MAQNLMQPLPRFLIVFFILVFSLALGFVTPWRIDFLGGTKVVILLGVIAAGVVAYQTRPSRA